MQVYSPSLDPRLIISQEALDEECEGLMDDPDGEPSDANLANLTIGFWEHCLTGVKESVKVPSPSKM